MACFNKEPDCNEFALSDVYLLIINSSYAGSDGNMEGSKQHPIRDNNLENHQTSSNDRRHERNATSTDSQATVGMP